jgi:hypothetical protein
MNINNFTAEKYIKYSKISDIYFNDSYGISIGYSNYNTIENNTFTRGGIFLEFPYKIDYYTNMTNKIINNYIDGKPIIYLEDSSGQTIDNTEHILLLRCNNIIIQDITFHDVFSLVQSLLSEQLTIRNCHLNDQPIFLYKTSNSLLKENIIDGFSFIFLHENCHNNTIINNAFNTHMSLIFFNSSNNQILSNNFNIRPRPTLGSIFLSIDSDNYWNKNYWYRPRILPKIILGIKTSQPILRLGYFTIDIDWRPALLPNEIPKNTNPTTLKTDSNENINQYYHLPFQLGLN